MRCKAGAGLRPTHYSYLESRPSTSLSWFEAVSENYMDSHGRPRERLRHIRQDYDVALHGVSMSLASAEGIRPGYLKNLKALIDEIEPFIVSDHLCWTGTHKSNVHDLLPFPYTKESLRVVIENLDHAQNILGRQLTIENVSVYMEFSESEFDEADFIVEVAKRTGAKILLDINNIYVSSQNLSFDPSDYLQKIPKHLVGQVHLAGYTDMGDFLFDTHSKPVYPQVWQLFSSFIKSAPHVPFMIEWDENIPPFAIVEQEVLKAKKIWEQHHGKHCRIGFEEQVA